MAQIFGYARVSTREQNEARQLLALREFGVEDERIFTDRQSGKDFDRPAYRRLVRRLRPGDTLAVKSIDRLGRNYREILEQWRILTHERRVGVVVLDMPLLDTRHANSSRRNADGGYRFAASQLCGRNGACLHPPAAGRGHRRRAGARADVRPSAAESSARIRGGAQPLELRRDEFACRGGAVGHIAADVPALGARNAVGHAMRRSRSKRHSVQSSSPRGRRHRKA